ncbi:DegV family EDD domain-containing protein [Spiroplasma endosymbiont of Anurida maritima]|uniref:DegV family protein n=1 Tax=Spiroplasma endosymbiont of Anurida maritima TaxID=2967972 RepID=UPI0036D42BAA
MEKIAFIVDSSAGYSKEQLEKFEDTYLIPISLLLPNAIEVEDTTSEISDDKFYEILSKESIKTSQISMGKFITKWDELLKTYDKIIFVGLGKGLSGQHSTAVQLSLEEKYLNKVFIIDTDGVSQILKAVFEKVYHWVTKDKVAIDKLQDKVDELKTKFSVYIVPKNLDTLRRGGRITPAAAALGKLLKITPILSYNGIIDKFDKTRTFKKAIINVLEQVKKDHIDLEGIHLVYSRTNEEDMDLVKSLIKDSELQIIEEHPLTKVITAHTGANTIVIIGWDKE